MRCSHCDDLIKKGDRAGVCQVHGMPGVTLKAGQKRCALCERCYKMQTADAPPEPVRDTRRCTCAPDPTGSRERFAAYGCPVHWPRASL